MQKLILLASLVVFVSGCASHFGAARIVSTPPGAEVISGEDGTSLGVTPATVFWKDGSANRKHLILRFQKEGYYEKVSSFWLSMRHASRDQAVQTPDLVEVVLQAKPE